MQRLPIKLLQPGMIVAREVLNDKGITLVNSETELDEKLIFRMENMHISLVLVQGTPVDLEEFQPVTLQKRIDDNDRAFSIHKDNPTMKQLRVLVKSHFLEKDKRERESENQSQNIDSRIADSAESLSENPEPEENIS